MGMIEDVGVVGQGREETQGKNTQRTTQNTKMSQGKKKPSKKVTLMHAHKQKDDR
jgi:hypothetical protein